MIDIQGNEPNLRYGFIPENIYQDLKFQDFSIRLDAAQILNKSVMSLSPSFISELSKANILSFFEFSKQFLIDENFGVINFFSEIIDFFFNNIDKSILRENLNAIIDMLLPPLQDKRNAVRNISSNLVIKYSTVLKSKDLLAHLILIFYDQQASTQIEILNIVGKLLIIPDFNLEDDNFDQKMINLVENSLLIVNVNVRSAAIKLLHQIKQISPEMYKSMPDEIKKVTEVESNSRVTTARLPRTPNSSLPSIYMSFNSNTMKLKMTQAQQTSSNAPDTASSKKRSDEFWYRSKPRFAKTAGFIIGKGGIVGIQPNAQQYSSTSNIPKIPKNQFVRTPDVIFQPQEPYSPLATDESTFHSNSNQINQVNLYEQLYENIGKLCDKRKTQSANEEEIEEQEIESNQPSNDDDDDIDYNEQLSYNYQKLVDTEYNKFDFNDNEEESTNYQSLDYNNKDLISRDINLEENEPINSSNENDERSAEFDEFDSMPSPRIASANKRKLNKASFININEQTDLGVNDKMQSQIEESTPKEPHMTFDEQDSPDHSTRPSPYQRRQFKPRPPSLPPSNSPPIFLSKNSDPTNLGDDQESNDKPQNGVLSIKKLRYPKGGASFRTKRNSMNSNISQPSTSSTSPKSQTKKSSSKPDINSIITDLQSTSDWEKQNSALTRIISLISTSPSFVQSNVRLLSFEIVPLCSSIRSALSKTALECLTSIASSFGSEMTPFFESIVNDLLTILLSSRGFITKLASSCISTIMHGVSKKKAIEYLTQDHRKKPGSCKAALAGCLNEIIGDCVRGDDEGVEVVSAEVMKAIASFITDANPDARKNAREAVKKLAQFDKNLAASVSNMRIDEADKKVVIDAIWK